MQNVAETLPTSYNPTGLKVAAFSLYDEAHWEQSMATRGFEKVAEADKGQFSPTAQKLTKKLFEELEETVRHFIQHGMIGLDHREQVAFMMAGPESVTAVTLNWLTSFPYERTKDEEEEKRHGLMRQAKLLGRSLLETAAFNLYLKQKDTKKVVEAYTRAKSRPEKFRLMKLLREWRVSLDDSTGADGKRDESLAINMGARAIQLIYKAFPDYITIRNVNLPENKTLSIVEKTDAWWDTHSDEQTTIGLSRPLLLPTIMPPKEWRDPASKKGVEVSDGGYYFLSKPMLKNVGKTVKPFFKVSQASYAALNWAQGTRWSLSKVHGVMQKAGAEGTILPVHPPMKDFRDMTREEKSEYSEWSRTMDAAAALVTVDSFGFPKQDDWRMRMYDMPTDLKPQGSDLAKGLLEFSDKVKVDAEGLRWLKIHMGNLLGFDKDRLEDRIKAAEDNEDLIQRIVSDPLRHQEWTVNAKGKVRKEAHQLLAACFAYADAMDGKSIGLPVALDGSCSGMQHYSMLSRDYSGAFATNCTSGNPPQDLYSKVGDAVQRRLEIDVANGVEMALIWWNSCISEKSSRRDVMKRPVMTKPYGVTDRGIIKFLVKETILKHYQEQFPEDIRWAAASYLMKYIKAAVDDVMRSATSYQAYFNGAAYHLAKKGKPLVWDTPTGSTIAQGYMNLKPRRVQTPLGTFQLMHEGTTPTFDERRAKMATSPNIIHSLDGAHLQMCVLGMKDAGIRDMALVHDSFGTHAKYVGEMRDILRQSMYDIYKDDQMVLWKESVERHSGEKIPGDLPQMGDWDVKEVLKADYLFA